MTYVSDILYDYDLLQALPLGTVVLELDSEIELEKVCVALGAYEVIGWSQTESSLWDSVWPDSAISLPVEIRRVGK